jgi:hypothetical protein
VVGLDKYPEWNPFIQQAIGKLKVDDEVDVKVRTETQDITLHCVVVKVVLNKEYS